MHFLLESPTELSCQMHGPIITTYTSHFERLKYKTVHILLRSEKEPVPKRVGTAAAFKAFPLTIPCGAAAPSMSCFRSFTK